ncbi:uncharacterized protein LOC128996934 [Macrosteles quadrilineatus]|uniref:uncharacterized protein LOC128996934 n=1 Tax=Macrosteles quadrilineatus TaxID=74068 RepID=UPI0023E32AA1|nr:uncharacterized protein LOC128996934 [Macrosteles quadrilineatus]
MMKSLLQVLLLRLLSLVVATADPSLDETVQQLKNSLHNVNYMKHTPGTFQFIKSPTAPAYGCVKGWSLSIAKPVWKSVSSSDHGIFLNDLGFETVILHVNKFCMSRKFFYISLGCCSPFWIHWNTLKEFDVPIVMRRLKFQIVKKSGKVKCNLLWNGETNEPTQTTFDLSNVFTLYIKPIPDTDTLEPTPDGDTLEPTPDGDTLDFRKKYIRGAIQTVVDSKKFQNHFKQLFEEATKDQCQFQDMRK